MSDKANTSLSRQELLKRCGQLARRVRPGLPPEGSSPGEFAWQCRALAERVQTYAELLNENQQRLLGDHLEYRLQRLETALGASLDYFRRVYLDLQPPDAEEEELTPPRPAGRRPADGQGLQ